MVKRLREIMYSEEFERGREGIQRMGKLVRDNFQVKESGGQGR